MTALRKTRRIIRPPPPVSLVAWLRDARGAAAVEFAIWLGVLIVPILGVLDVGFFIHERMQLENAAHVGAERIWTKCTLASGYTPALKNCSGVWGDINTLMTTQTSLQTAVTLTKISEGYYCPDKTGALHALATPVSITKSNGSATPTGATLDCSTSGYTTAHIPSGDYVQVTVTTPYNSPFKSLSLVTAILNPGGAALTQTAWTRLQ